MEEEKKKVNPTKVYCRLRPLNVFENDRQNSLGLDRKLLKQFPRGIIKVSDKVAGILTKSCDNDKNLCKIQSFRFDKVFDFDSSQEEVYGSSVEGDVVNSIRNGENCVVTFYGDGCSGKSYTCCGTPSNNGIVPRVLHTCCSVHHLEIKFSIMSIYDEKIKDLVHLGKEFLKIKQTKTEGIFVEGLSQTATTINLLVKKGERH